MARRSRSKQRPRAALFWGVATFLLYLLLATLDLEVLHPEVYDPEYAARLKLLRARQGESPDRPLLLVGGSSRVAMGFQPECLPPFTDDAGRAVLPFNFSQFGSGPVMNLMRVRRLLDDGVRPAWLVVELMPAFLRDEGSHFVLLTAGARDLPDLSRYLPAWKVGYHYARRRAQLVPRYPLHWLGAEPVDGRTTISERSFAPLGGYIHLRDQVTPEQREAFLARERSRVGRQLADGRVVPAADRATRDLIELCRAEGIGLVLLLTPESERFRRLYGAAGRAWLCGYATELRRAYGVGLIDAGAWLAEEDLQDGHHPLRRGAETFSRRLADELRPLLTSVRYRGPGSQ